MSVAIFRRKFNIPATREPTLSEFELECLVEAFRAFAWP
jgi:hypothetical protein